MPRSCRSLCNIHPIRKSLSLDPASHHQLSGLALPRAYSPGTYHFFVSRVVNMSAGRDQIVFPHTRGFFRFRKVASINHATNIASPLSLLRTPQHSNGAETFKVCSPHIFLEIPTFFYRVLTKLKAYPRATSPRSRKPTTLECVSGDLSEIKIFGGSK